MENQGYEEDHSRAEKKQSKLEFCYCNQSVNAGTFDDDANVTRTIPYSENHVYEDISIGDSSTVSESFPVECPNTCGIKDYQFTDISKQVWINGSPSILSSVIEKSNTFERNTILSSSSPVIGVYHDSASPSSQIVSKTSGEDLDPERSSGKLCYDTSRPVLGDNSDSVFFSASRGNKDPSRNVSTQFNRRPNRRRKKKDCKHCRNKLIAANSCDKINEIADSKDAILRENQDNDRNKNSDVTRFLFSDTLLRPQNIKIYPIVKRTSLLDIGPKKHFSTSLSISKNALRSSKDSTSFLMNRNRNEILNQMTENEQRKMLGVLKSETDMRINSIYSQERWYGKESQIFYTNVKDHNPFQRAYSLPVRTHTPTSQNRVNLRRSARNEPPPHPARLDKHHRGWTLHLARPLKASGCSNSLVSLLIIVLILLAVAGIALYIVFEPEKLQIIQQYLKSSTGKLSAQNITSGKSFTSVTLNDEPNLAITTTRPTKTTTTIKTTTTTSMTTMLQASANVFGALLNDDLSFPESTLAPTETEAEASGQQLNANAIRYCNDCLDDEVCVALVYEEVPICRSPHDREDPTGCAGFCVINKQKCHRLDVDAFRCVEMEHYCLDNEWTCSNALCIPLEKHCDGHMNCYDHSDEYNCFCNLETHFQCGNETSCLPLERRCDGKIDCWDATDEINCTLACPLESEFTCSNGECILKTRFCDGLPDCSDRSDEPHGCQGRCNKHEFTCQNGRCITKGMKCNGIDDCGDGTDERYCKIRFT